MARRIILQLGLHKTATTSLQDFLMEHHRQLAIKGVRYIPLQRMRGDITPLFWSLDKGRREKLAQFVDEVDHHTVLFSDENIIGTPGDLTQGTLYPYARNRIETFCEEMAGREITLFLTLREPHRFLVSMYCEFLRHNEFITFGEYLAAFDVPAFSYRKTFGWLRTLPPNTRVRVIPFESHHGGGVIHIARQLVEEACGLDSGIDPEAFPGKRSRAAFSVEELDLAADIARRADPRVTQFFLNLIDHREKRFGSTIFEPLPAQLAAVLSERYAADLAFFRG